MSTWKLDAAHSHIGFKIKHLMVSTVRGEFTQFEGTITAADDTFANASVAFTAQTASVSTHNAGRDGHLTSPDVFNVEKFPTISFMSKSFAKADDSTYKVTGDFTMLGVTKEITLDAEFDGIGTGMDGKRVVSFGITGSIKRTDFGMTFNIPLATGGIALGEDVKLDIQVEAKEE